MPFLNLNFFSFFLLWKSESSSPSTPPPKSEAIKHFPLRYRRQHVLPLQGCCAWAHRRTTAELAPVGAAPVPRPPSEGMKASSSRGLFLMVQIFQLQNSLKAFLMVSFGRNASIYLICQDFTRPSKNTENFSHCLKCLEHFRIHIFYLYSKKS